MRRSRRILLGIDEPVYLERILTPPPELDERRYKCRLAYGETLGSLEYVAYDIRPVQTLKLITADTIDYSHKFTDRTALDALRRGRGECDEIIIVIDGNLTDTTYSNIALYDGLQWVTPDTPLLAGTKREELLLSGAVTEKTISREDLHEYSKISLINAMLDLGDVEIPIQRVI